MRVRRVDSGAAAVLVDPSTYAADLLEEEAMTAEEEAKRRERDEFLRRISTQSLSTLNKKTTLNDIEPWRS